MNNDTPAATVAPVTDAEKITKLQQHCGRLANLALFAINNLKPKAGAGLVMHRDDKNAEQHKTTPWKAHFREELGKCGLIVVDPEPRNKKVSK